MTAHLLDALFSFIGAMIPGTLHVAWKITRGSKTDAGTIDLTAYKTRP